MRQVPLETCGGASAFESFAPFGVSRTLLLMLEPSDLFASSTRTTVCARVIPIRCGANRKPEA